MRNTVAGIAMTVACISGAAAAPVKQETSPVHFMINVGLTTGGDKLASAQYTSGDTASIHGGGLFEIGAGIQYFDHTHPFSGSLTLNWHFDRANAKNGSIKFTRFPIELMGYYHFSQKWRAGLGLRHAMSPEVTIDFDGQPSESWTYKDTNSPMFEVGYGAGRGWIGLRYVKEDLKFEQYQSGNTVIRAADLRGDLTDDGSHFGLFFSYGF